LRKGMEGIRDAVSSFYEGKFEQGDATSLAAAIDKNVSLMIENCDLQPKADATLHALLGTILDGKTRLLQNPHEKTGMNRIIDALHKYPEYFAHEDWQPPAVDH
ncbi:MAG: hypothetical protein HUJ31_07370, partial [Pseudomonadales bacterium]|nr:hypothetical protein [Pseudomonadales bacterium]